MGHRWQRGSDVPEDLPEIRDFANLLLLVEHNPVSYIRYSFGPAADAAEESWDHASGQPLPGLSVNPLTPPPWWRERPVAEWIARQIVTYVHLRSAPSGRRAWVLLGRVVGRGPDNEPLVDCAVPLAWLSETVIDEAMRRAPASSRAQDGDRSAMAPWQAH